MFPAHEGASFVGRKGAVLSWRKRFPPFLSPAFKKIISFFELWLQYSWKRQFGVNLWWEAWHLFVSAVKRHVCIVCARRSAGPTVNRWVRGLCSPFPSSQKLFLWDIAPSQLFTASPHDPHTALKLASNTNYFKEDVMWAAGCSTVGHGFLKM